MDAHEFLSATVCCMEQPSVELLKSMLVGRYLRFGFVPDEDVGTAALAEKLGDYFDKVGLRTSRSFDDCISSYMAELNSIVEPRVVKAAPAHGKEKEGAVTRAWRYYERFAETARSHDRTVDDIIDHSRVMLCLYQAIIDNGKGPIENFDYASDAIKPATILKHMRWEERRGILPPFASKRFDTEDPYGTGAFSIVMAGVMLATFAHAEDKGADDE